MKRTRADQAATKLSPASPKPHKKAKSAAKARKAHNAAAAGMRDQEQYLLEAAAAALGMEGDVGFGRWCGSVEGDLLLGWFPWAGPTWEEEEEAEGYRDIWQLQHIHEIPGGAASSK